MNRKDWPAYKVFIWKWQFVMGGVLCLLVAAFLFFQVAYSIQQNHYYQENGETLQAEVVDREFGVFAWLLGDGDGWYQPYKYTFVFSGKNHEACQLTSDHWDWVLAASTHQAFNVGDVVNIAVLDGCDARLVSDVVAYRYWSWKGMHVSAAIILSFFLFFMHKKHQKTYE